MRAWQRVGGGIIRYNPLPDEKGTESPYASLPSFSCAGYNPLPDEKGTESAILFPFIFVENVTILYPMKRGLKGA